MVAHVRTSGNLRYTDVGRNYLGCASAACIAFAASASRALPLRERLVNVGLFAVACGECEGKCYCANDT